MANETAVPLLPCASIDDMADFYGMLGFEITYRQQRPNPYLATRREDLQLHFFGLPDFDPDDSYGSCLVYVPDIAKIHAEFSAGMRAVHGKLLVSGTPRMTRPRRRKNSDRLSGFTVVDPGGNWIRIFERASASAEVREPPRGRLASTLETAVVLGDSRGDHRQAAHLLDAALQRHRETADTVDLVESLVYRAELAIRLEERARAAALLAEVAGLPLPVAERERLREPLATATELERILGLDDT